MVPETVLVCVDREFQEEPSFVKERTLLKKALESLFSSAYAAQSYREMGEKKCPHVSFLL